MLRRPFRIPSGPLLAGAACAIALAGTTGASAAVTFGPAAVYPSNGFDIWTMNVDDMDGDGRPDGIVPGSIRGTSTFRRSAS